MNKSEAIRKIVIRSKKGLKTSQILNQVEKDLGVPVGLSLVAVVLSNMKKEGTAIHDEVSNTYMHKDHAKPKPRQCASLTRKGKRCGHKASRSSDLCSIHIGMNRKANKLSSCKRCGRTSHDESKCYAKTDVRGKTITPYTKKLAGKPVEYISKEEYHKVLAATEPTDPIASMFDELKTFVMQKNSSYGNSVLDPVRVFSKADKKEQIRVRIDDKLSRLVRGNSDIESDTDIIKDLIGYLVLLLVNMEGGE